MRYHYRGNGASSAVRLSARIASVIKESRQFWSPATQGQVWRDVIVPRSLRGIVAVFSGVVLTIGASVTANAAPWSADSFTRLARRCAPLAAPSTLASIARVESGFDPLMISDNNSKHSFAPNSVAEAARLATQLIAAGHSVDVGLMQINSSNFARTGLTVPAAFDPCLSLAAGAAILAAGYSGGVSHSSQQAALRVALSRYNTGDAERGFTNGYVARVERAAQRVVPAIDLASNGQTADAPRRPDGSGRALRPQPETAPGASGGPLSWLVWADDSVTPHSDDGAAVRLAPPTAIIADAGQGAAAAVTNYASPETR